MSLNQELKTKKSLPFLTRVKTVSFFIPFRVHLILFIGLLFTGYIWLKKNVALPNSSYDEIVHLLITITLWFVALILMIGFISAIIPWLLLLLNRKSGLTEFKIKTASDNTEAGQKPAVSITLHPAIKPLFGFVRFRLEHDKGLSKKFTLTNSGSNQLFFPTTLDGIYNWPAPDIREYNITGSLIYFEDMFQLFSFVAELPSQDSFVTQPGTLAGISYLAKPKKTFDTTVRVEEIRKVEGEFLNYKNFENNDDVRRIVWKIYAKNKELVVRTPETNDPYDSHIYFYASFYNHFRNDLNQQLDAVFLNYFKTQTWNAYWQLSKQNVEVKYIPDQPTRLALSNDPLQKVKYIISTSEWQTNTDLKQYFKKGEASVLCFSSLTNKTQAAEILENSGKDLVIIFVRLSLAFSRVKVSDWMKYIFVKPSGDSLEKLRLAWNISPLKNNLLQNEKELLRLLEKCDCEKQVL